MESVEIPFFGETPIHQENYIKIIKEFKSNQGNDISFQIFFKDNKFHISLEKQGKIFKEKYLNKYSLKQIQENEYFKLFSNVEEILGELKERIEAKNPILNEYDNNINVTIFLPVSKFKQIDFNIPKVDYRLKDNDFKQIIGQLYQKIDILEKENEEIKKENKRLEIRIENLENICKNNIDKIYKNFRWINKEVYIVNSSEFTQICPPEIMLGKKNGDYSLTVGNRNKFIEFSFIKTYFLKSIRIKVDNFECTIKNFKVEVISENGEKNSVGSFIRDRYNDNDGFQEFPINKECKGIKLDLIDNWGEIGGNYILISRIDFNVSD